MSTFSRGFTVFSAAMLMGLYSSTAFAGITLDKVIVKFAAEGRPVTNMVVTNTGNKTVKISSSVIHTFHPGQDDEVEERTRDVTVAPKAFELKPNEKRTVRIILRKIPEDLEEVYRIRFKPSTIQTAVEKKANGVSVKIGVVTAMGALVMAAPRHPEPGLTFKRSGDQIAFTNTGNVVARLAREDFCNAGKSVCTALTGKRVYPGATWSVDVPVALRGKAFRQTLFMNGEYSTLEYPAQ